MYGSWPVTVAGHCTLTRGCNCTRSSTRCEPIGSVWARRMSLCRHRIALKFGIPSLGLLLGAPVSRPIGVRNGGVYLPGMGAGMAPSAPRRRGAMLLQDRGSLPHDRQCLRVVALPSRYDNNCHSVSSSILFCFRYDMAPSQEGQGKAGGSCGS